MPPGDTTTVGNLLSWVVDPMQAAHELAEMLGASGIMLIIQQIGLALLYLFALIELYRLWFRGTGTDFAVLAAKVAIINFLITGSTINNAALSIYSWTLQAAYYIAGHAAATSVNQLWDAVALITTGPAPSGNWLATLVYSLQNLGNVILMIGLVIVFFIVLAFVLAAYAFALLGSAVIYSLAIMLVPLLFPTFIWPATANFGGRWVSTMLHALFMPLIGATMLFAALQLGLVTPINQWAQCVAQAPNGGSAAVNCLAGGVGTLLKAIMGGLVAIFLMFSVNGVVSNFFPAAEVTTAGLLAGKFALGGARKAVGAAAGAAFGGGGRGAGAVGSAGAAGVAASGGGGSRTSISSAPPGRSPGSAPEISPVPAGVRAGEWFAPTVSPGEIEWALDQAGLMA